MKKRYFAAYMLIIAVALLSLPLAFGKWSQSVGISGYIKTAETELESKEDKSLNLVSENGMPQKPEMPEGASAPAEENSIEAEPESSSSPEPRQETAEDGLPENPVENSSDQGGVSAEIGTEGDEIPAGAEAIPGDDKPEESGPDVSPADDEEAQGDYSRAQEECESELELESETAPET